MTPEEATELGYAIGLAECRICSRKWLAAYWPESEGQDLECPACGYMTGDVGEEEEECYG